MLRILQNFRNNHPYFLYFKIHIIQIKNQQSRISNYEVSAYIIKMVRKVLKNSNRKNSEFFKTTTPIFTLQISHLPINSQQSVITK